MKSEAKLYLLEVNNIYVDDARRTTHGVQLTTHDERRTTDTGELKLQSSILF